MTREELLRILTFVDSNREIAEKRTPLATVDPRWNIVSYAMRRHFEGKLVTVTSAAMAADVPYGTAMRRISELIDEGLLHKRPKSRSGKSFSLHPTRTLIREFESFAMQLKVVVGNTFGFTTTEGEISDFYFGGYYMASRILPYPSAMRVGVGNDRTIRILGSVDPTFKTLKEFSSNLDELCGTKVEIVNLPLDQLHREIMENSERKTSKYDLVAVDLPWIGQLATEGVIDPLDDLMEEARYNPSDFHNAAYRGSSWNNRQYGLPIQPTAELLFCRSDLFAEAGLAIPKTTEDVLLSARVLHRAGLNLSGIVMNYGRGIPVAHTFVQTMADFGQPVINLSPLGDEFDVATIERENYRPQLQSDAARATAEFLLELAEFSHKESLVCNWDRRIDIFSRGEAAMTYGWSIRAAAFERNETAQAHGKVEFVPHPHAPGARTVSPIGGFSLAIPAQLDPRRKSSSWKVMEYLTRPEMLKWYVLNGNLTSPRFSTSADPEVQASSKIIAQVDGMDRRGELQTWPRPPIPEFSSILDVLGDEIHMMLQRVQGIDEALTKSQNRIDAIMRERGHF
ncbi:ABC transporter substrate-binding protein [Roseivivax halodurans JCM 10272]|uniref:ABC transporter substrate-binding protein n=1 Tax=Roseivivax halodurans JCM 10272 TaxID=1449350 RepID=X7EDI9_9RHOB|nr:extracellular solute-binding protein [Roseivivax halodurans]ETX13915.1 ABC transporter substrate-binding protein [Roseivivax halodurans JCM 10272]